MTIIGSRLRAMLLALHILAMGALAGPAPAQAMQILDAADHAELSAEISATNVNRIALAGDRIAKVVRAPDGFAAEHDAASGDLYLRPLRAEAAAPDPVSLFIGTERGFTYRLTLIPAARDSAQILIRNADAVPSSTAFAASPSAGEPQIAAMVRLVRAVAGRKPLPGAAIHAGGESLAPGIRLIETWRGPRFAALVFEAERPASEDADGVWPGHGSGLADLAGTIENLPDIGPVAALWLAPPATGPSGGRLGVAVVEAAGAGSPR